MMLLVAAAAASCCCLEGAAAAVRAPSIGTRRLPPPPRSAAGMDGGGPVSDWAGTILKSTLSPLERDAEERVARDPPDLSRLAPLEAEGKHADAVLLFCGSGGSKSVTQNLARALRDADAKVGVVRPVFEIDWETARGGPWRAAFDGQRVGSHYARELVQAPWAKLPLRSVHALGGSVGAFAADACVSALRDALGDSVHLRLSLLDPFTYRGIWGVGYGARQFGRAADFCEQVMNTDDPVPSTNEPLDHAYCMDVTGARARDRWRLPADEDEGTSGHAWPVQWFADYVSTTLDADGKPECLTHADRPRGQVIKVQ